MSARGRQSLAVFAACVGLVLASGGAGADPARALAERLDAPTTAADELRELLVASQQLGPLADDARARLASSARRLCTHADALVRREAALALGRLGAETDLECLAELARSRAAGDRKVAATAIGWMGVRGAAGRVVLRGLLGDSTSAVRCAAAEALGQLPVDPESAARLARAADEGDADLRAAATRALGLVGGSDAVRHLSRRLADDAAFVREAAVGALGQLTGGEAGEALAQATWDADGAVRALAIEVLYQRGETSGLWPVIEQLASDRAAERHAAIALLVKLTGEDRGYRADGEVNEHRAAVEAWRRWLQEQWRAAPSEQRLALLLAGVRSPTARVRDEAGRQLAALRDARLVPRLALEYARVEDPLAREWLLRAVAPMGGPEAAALCARALGTEPVRLRQLAAEALARGAGAAEVPALVRALSDTDDLVRISSTEALARLRPPEAALALARVATADRSDAARKGALKALLELTVPVPRAVLETALRDPVEANRMLACQAASRVAGADAAPLLVRALEDTAPRIRAVAAEALGERPGPESALALARAIEDADDDVRRAAIGAVARIATAVDAAVLERIVLAALADRDEAVQVVAVGVASACKLRAASARVAALAHGRSRTLVPAAVRALGRIGDARHVEDLWTVAQGGHPDDGPIAIAAIAAIDGAAALRTLERAARELRTPAVLEEIVEQLRRRASPDGVPAIVAIGRRREVELQVAALRALERTGLDGAATELVRELLRKGPGSARRAALACCAALAPQALGETVAELVRDAPDAVDLEAAALALAAYRDARAVRVLGEALATEADPARVLALVRALGRTRDPAAAEALVARIDDEDAPTETREAALAAYGELAPDGSSHDTWERLLLAPGSGLRAIACRYVEPLASASPVDSALHALLRRERVPSVLRAALATLADRSLPPPADLVEAWLDPLRPELAADAARAWCGAAAPGAARRVAALVRSPACPPATRRALTAALVGTGSADGLDELVALAADADPAIRQEAVLGLGRFGSPRARAVLIERLADASAPVRGVAVWALAEISSADADPARVAAAARDADPFVRGMAALALARVGQRGDPEALVSLLESGVEPAAAVMAALALARQPSAAAYAPLIRGLDAPEPERVRASAIALGALGDARAVPALAGALVGQPPRVEAAVADALLALGAAEPRVVATLRRCLPRLAAELAGPDRMRRTLARDQLARHAFAGATEIPLGELLAAQATSFPPERRRELAARVWAKLCTQPSRRPGWSER